MGSVGAVIFLPREADGRSLMLETLVFSPAALWVAEALKNAGVTDFFVICHGDDRVAAAACFPPDATFVSGGSDAKVQLAAFLRQITGKVVVVSRAVAMTFACARNLLLDQPQVLSNEGRDTGVCRMDASALADALAGGSGLEDAIASGADRLGGSVWEQSAKLLTGEWIGHANAEYTLRTAAAHELMASGVRVMDPAVVYLDPTVRVGAGTALLPGTILRGNTTIGEHCQIGPNTTICDCQIGNRVVVNASQLNESRVDDGATIGPFAYIRPHCHVGADVKVGDFVELKNSVVGAGTKISHLTYVGDSDVGRGVNFGCGTVTVNYDGNSKYRTTIGDDAFIGCNTNLVAPVQVGEGAYTAAGSTITEDVPADSLAIARSQQVIKKQWATKRKKK